MAEQGLEYPLCNLGVGTACWWDSGGAASEAGKATTSANKIFTGLGSCHCESQGRRQEADASSAPTCGDTVSNDCNTRDTQPYPLG